MELTSRIFVAGHRGLVGAAIVRKLESNGFTNIITRPHVELDLTNQQAVQEFFRKEKPEYVFLAAAKVGGILANRDFPVDFLLENLLIETSVIPAAYAAGVTKLLFLGSSCIYPKYAPQPIPESALLTGELEQTNQPYAIAKIAGIELCISYRRQHAANFISVMPTNLYGPGDSFHPEHSHVIPGLMQRLYKASLTAAPSISVWGTGSARREFMHVDDLADACLFLMEKYDEEEIVNIGTGQDISIKELAQLIVATANYSGRIEWDTTKPDGTPQKLLDVSKLHALGWHHSIDLQAGLADTYAWYVEHNSDNEIS